MIKTRDAFHFGKTLRVHYFLTDSFLTLYGFSASLVLPSAPGIVLKDDPLPPPTTRVLADQCKMTDHRNDLSKREDVIKTYDHRITENTARQMDIKLEQDHYHVL